jgi:hypothetical protein
MNNPVSLVHALQSERYLNLRLHEKALAEAEKALSLDPNDPTCHAAMAEALVMGGRPEEAVDYARKGMRLDPQNPSRYLKLMGRAHFCMGEMKKAVRSYEDSNKYNPGLGSEKLILAAACAHLGRDEEARALLEKHKNRWVENVGDRAPYLFRMIMFFLPFKSHPPVDLLVEGLRKAKFPGDLSYYPVFEENRLTGEEIRELLLGSKISGFVPGRGEVWTRYGTDGKTIFSSGNDQGTTRIMADMGCSQRGKGYWGSEYCWTVFRNPNGNPQRRDEYMLVMDIGLMAFSTVK